MSVDARNKIKRTIQEAYAKKGSAKQALNDVYEIVDDDDEWDDGEDDEDDLGESDGSDNGDDDDDGNDDGEDGGIIGAVIDLFTSNDEDDEE